MRTQRWGLKLIGQKHHIVVHTDVQNLGTVTIHSPTILYYIRKFKHQRRGDISISTILCYLNTSKWFILGLSFTQHTTNAPLSLPASAYIQEVSLKNFLVIAVSVGIWWERRTMGIYLNDLLGHADHNYLVWIRTKNHRSFQCLRQRNNAESNSSVYKRLRDGNDLKGESCSMWSFAFFGFMGLIIGPWQQPFYDGRKDIVGMTLKLFTSMRLMCKECLPPRTFWKNTTLIN